MSIKERMDKVRADCADTAKKLAERHDNVLINPKVGDIVFFDCGGRARLTRVEYSNEHAGAWFLCFENYNEHGAHYAPDGHLYAAQTGKKTPSILTITHIVKRGEA